MHCAGKRVEEDIIAGSLSGIPLQVWRLPMFLSILQEQFGVTLVVVYEETCLQQMPTVSS